MCQRLCFCRSFGTFLISPHRLPSCRFTTLYFLFAYLKHFHYFCVNIKSPQLYQTQIPKSANMKKHFFFFLFLISSFLAAAQTYNYIGVEDGLSNRRVYAIQKGLKVTCGSSRTTASTVITERNSSTINSWTAKMKSTP